MKQILASAIFLTVMATFFIPSPAAASDIAWSVGSAFRIGGASFHIAVRDGYYGGAPYYYRTRRPIERRGYACGSACFRAESYYYHDPYCPLASAYFSGYGYSSFDLYGRYGPHSEIHFRYGPPYYRYGVPYRGYPPHAYSHGPGYYAPYGYNLDRRGGRYKRYDRHDRRGHDSGNHHGRHKSRGHD